MPRLAQWSTLQRVAATLGSSVVVFVFAGLVYLGLGQQAADRAAVARTHRVIEAVDQVHAYLTDAETAQRGYLLTGSERYLQPYAEAEQEAIQELSTLRALIKNNPAQEARVDSLAELLRAKVAELDSAIAFERAAHHEAAVAVLESDRGKRIMDETRRVAGRMAQTETGLLALRTARQAHVAVVIRGILVAGTLAAIAVAILINTLLARYAAAQERAARDLDAQNARLEEQATELEQQNLQLHDQAVEMEIQQQHLQEQAFELEAQTEELRTINSTLEETAESLRIGEERLRLALGAGRLGPWEWDIATGAVIWSPAVEAMHGIDSGTFGGTFEAYQRDIHPDDRERVLSTIRDTADQQAPHYLRYRIVRPDGETRWLEAHGTLILDAAGCPARVVGVCADITERQRTEDGLRFIAKASAVLASSLDYERTLAAVAQLAVPALADWCAVDIVNQRGTLERLAVAHPDPAKVALAKELESRYPEDPNSPVGRYHVLRTGVPESMSDIPDELLVAGARDAEHLRSIRALGLRSYMTVPLIVRGDVLGVMSFVSAESGRRYADADVALAEDLAHRAAAAIDNARLYRDISEARELVEQQAAEMEMSNEELEMTTEELTSSNDQLQMANTALERTVAERETERAAAVAARRAAEAANAAKSEFLATMSHELRTPLNAIGGYADILAMGIRGPVTDAQLEDLRRIKKSGTHLLSLINDILNLARIEAGRLDLRVTDVPLVEVLDDVETLMTPQMRAKGIDCTYAQCDAALTARADAEKLQQILLNLLTNACKFTVAGGRVAVECHVSPGSMSHDDVASGTAHGAGTVIVRVRDTGRGIPQAKLKSIFEPFVQIDRHESHESQQGVGLGLAISRDLARAMGGELSAESTVDEGSVFTLTLPRGSRGVSAPVEERLRDARLDRSDESRMR